MTTTDFTQQYQSLENGVVVGSDGSDIGKVGRVYTDNDTGAPSWVTVKTGWFGTSESFVPLNSATVEGDAIRVPFDKDTIKGAPHNEAGEPLSEDDERELYSYYGVTTQSGANTESAVEQTSGDGHNGTPVPSTEVDPSFADHAREQLDTTGTAGTDTEVPTGRVSDDTDNGYRV